MALCRGVLDMKKGLLFMALALVLSSVNMVIQPADTAKAVSCTKIDDKKRSYKIKSARHDDETAPLKLTTIIYTNKCTPSNNRYAKKMTIKLGAYDSTCRKTHNAWLKVNPDKFAHKNVGTFKLTCGKSKTIQLSMKSIKASDTENRCLNVSYSLHTASGGGKGITQSNCAP